MRYPSLLLGHGAKSRPPVGAGVSQSASESSWGSPRGHDGKMYYFVRIP